MIVITWFTFEINFSLNFSYLYAAALSLYKSILPCCLCYLGLFGSRLICADDEG